MGSVPQHRPAASDRTAVTLSSGAQAVDPGDTVELQVYVQSDVAEVAGVTFATSDGDLLAGENTASSRGDIVQPEPVPLVEGSARFTFSLLVPESDTTVRVYGAGNAANDDGEKTGDRWNFAQDLEITVGTGGAVDDTGSPADTAVDDTGAPSGGCSCDGGAGTALPLLTLLSLGASRRRRG